jgi:putative ABC transport system substrate-binding protein
LETFTETESGADDDRPSGAAAWPLAARAQQGERVRRIGVLMNLAADDAEGQSRIAAFLQAMRELGWSADRNMRIDIRWAGNDNERHRRYAAELVAFAPDVFLASASPAVMALQQVASTVPIVFVGVSDPVGAALSTAWHGRAVGSPDLPSSSTASARMA